MIRVWHIPGHLGNTGLGKEIDALNDLHIAGAIDFEKPDEGR